MGDQQSFPRTSATTSDSHTNTYSNPDANANAYTDPNPNSYADSDSNSIPNPNAITYPYTNTITYSYPNTVTYSNTFSNSYSIAYSNSESYSVSYTCHCRYYDSNARITRSNNRIASGIELKARGFNRNPYSSSPRSSIRNGVLHMVEEEAG